MNEPKKSASILQESKKRQHKNKAWWIAAVVMACGVGIYFGFFNSKLSTEPAAPAQVVTPTRGDLRMSIESDGSIINPNIVGLSFFINGTLDKIYVEAAERVEAGQLLAELDTRDLEFDLRSAESALQIAYANYQAKAAMLTDTQLRELETSLKSQQDELDSIRLDVGQSLQQALDLGVEELETVFPALDSALQLADSFLLIDTNFSGYSSILNATHNSVAENNAREMYRQYQYDLNALSAKYHAERNLSNTSITSYLRETRTLTQSVQDLMNTLVGVMRSATASSQVTQSHIDSARNSLTSMNSKMLSEIGSLTSSIQRIESAYLSQQNKLISAENSIEKLQTQIETAKDSVQEKEVSKQTSLSVLSAQITQAKIKVEQAQYNLEQAQLVAPISGEVIEVNGNEGETIKMDSVSSDTAFIKILSDSNFTTEVYVEEIDIAQIKKGQRVLITLDAIPDVELEGTVTFISSTATTSGSGVVTYLVRVEIMDAQDAPIKEGMTTYVEFLTQETTDAILVPVDAIKKRGTRNVVILVDGEPREVEVGMTDGVMTEIVSGLALDEQILVGGDAAPVGGANRGATTDGPRELSEEMITRMREAGFSDAEIEQVKSGEMTTEMREKLRSTGGGGMRGMGGSRPPH